jgi:hypothetical protein
VRFRDRPSSWPDDTTWLTSTTSAASTALPARPRLHRHAAELEIQLGRGRVHKGQVSTQSSEHALADDQSVYARLPFGGVYFAFALLVKGNSDSRAYVEQ